MLEYTVTIHPEFGLDLALSYAWCDLSVGGEMAIETGDPRRMDENHYIVDYDVYSRHADAKVRSVRVHFILSEKVHEGDGLHWRKGGVRK